MRRPGRHPSRRSTAGQWGVRAVRGCSEHRLPGVPVRAYGAIGVSFARLRCGTFSATSPPSCADNGTGVGAHDDCGSGAGLGLAGQAGVLRAGGRDLVELHRDPMPSDFGLVAGIDSPALVRGRTACSMRCTALRLVGGELAVAVEQVTARPRWPGRSRRRRADPLGDPASVRRDGPLRQRPRARGGDRVGQHQEA